MFSILSKIFLLTLITFGLSVQSALACGEYSETYKCSSKIIPRATLRVQKQIVDGFGTYKFELSVGPLFKKKYFFVDDNQWASFDKKKVRAVFTSKTYCENNTLVSETYTDYKAWSKRIYDDIEIIQNPDYTLTINTNYWTAKPGDEKAPVKKPYQWKCK